MKFAIIHSEQPDPPLERGPRPEEPHREHGPLPLPASPYTATERPLARALADTRRAHAGLNRLRYTVESTSSTLTHSAENFEDTEPEAGLETFNPMLFGLTGRESDHG